MILAEEIRREIAHQARITRTLLEDVERRIAQGTPSTLTATSCRALHGNVTRLLELASELKGVDP